MWKYFLNDIGTARCLAPPQAGHFHCSAVNTEKTIRPILMVYFDKVSGKCRWFTYYGCGGSANRFTSITECEDTCGNKIADKIVLGKFISVNLYF